MKRWFLIGELQAARVPDDFLQLLQEVHSDLSKTQARKCFFEGTFAYRPEFHISLFSRDQRRALFRQYRTELDKS